MSITQEFKVTCSICQIYRRFEAASVGEAKMKFRSSGWQFGGMGNPVWKCSRHPEIDINVRNGREVATTGNAVVDEGEVLVLQGPLVQETKD